MKSYFAITWFYCVIFLLALTLNRIAIVDAVPAPQYYQDSYYPQQQNYYGQQEQPRKHHSKLKGALFGALAGAGTQSARNRLNGPGGKHHSKAKGAFWGAITGAFTQWARNRH